MLIFERETLENKLKELKVLKDLKLKSDNYLDELDQVKYENKKLIETVSIKEQEISSLAKDKTELVNQNESLKKEIKTLKSKLMSYCKKIKEIKKKSGIQLTSVKVNYISQNS